MDKEQIIWIAERKAPQEYMIGSVVALVGLILIGAGLYLAALVPLFLAVVIFSLGRGCFIDLKNGNYGDYSSTLGAKKLKNAKPMDGVEYLGLVRVGLGRKMWVQSIQTDTSEMMCKFNLVHPNNKFTTMGYGKKEQMFAMAERVAKSSNLKIYDVTTPEKKWINPSDLE